ncbi:STAS domain-containing protein [Pseudonocardia sp. GCM10023141]|uniref:STAS domain-containing protein n=1 Tax=Pseudonocardia sp. GCM10023141 TaxID=3252653 RepID=UPI003608B2DA
MLSTLTGPLGETCVVAVGEVDLATAGELLACWDGALAHPSCRTVVVDLRAVGFLGTQGLDVLGLASARARAADVWLAVVADHRAVLRPLQITGAGEWCAVSRRCLRLALPGPVVAGIRRLPAVGARPGCGMGPPRSPVTVNRATACFRHDGRRVGSAPARLTCPRRTRHRHRRSCQPTCGTHRIQPDPSREEHQRVHMSEQGRRR